MIKVEIGNNICQCFNEITNSKIYVQSDEKGLFFNLNDALSIFLTDDDLDAIYNVIYLED